MALAFAAFTLVHLVRVFAGGVLTHNATTASELCMPFQVDLNEADLADLTTLPGIGSSRAAAIVLHRVRHGPFRSIDDLDRVEGFGSALVEQVRPFLRDPKIPGSIRIR